MPATALHRAGAAQGAGFDRVREAAGEIAPGAMPGIAVATVHKGRIVFAEGFGVASGAASSL